MSNQTIYILAFESCAILVSCSISFILSVQKKYTKNDRNVLIIVLLGALLLMNDSLQYRFDGNPSQVASVIMRITNPMLYICAYLQLAAVGNYLYDYLKPNKKFIYYLLFAISIIASLLTLIGIPFHWFYYIDAMNVYHRTKTYVLCQIPTIIGIIVLLFAILKNKENIPRNQFASFLSYIIFPCIACIIQTFIYGWPLQNLAIVFSSWNLFLARELDLRNQLEQANHTKTDFLNRMSHDIRTPLNGILGIIEIDDQHPNDVEFLSKNRAKAKIAANHLLSLLTDVLQFSKLEEKSIVLAHEAFDLNQLVDEVFVIAELKAKTMNITLEKKKQDIPNPYLYGSPLHIRQILLNIMDNSIKYNKPNGSVYLEVKPLYSKEGSIQYQFIITDTGIGMSDEYIEHIFEPFSQERQDARSIYMGTGLGMAIVKGLIEEMNGLLKVESKVDEGSKFIIEIPFELANEIEIKKETKANNVDLSNKRILLVEDNDLNREITKTILEEKNIEIIEAIDGLEALNIFKEKKTHFFDLILMDIMMPNMNGLESAQAIRSLNREDAKEIPIIALSANAFEEDAQKAKKAGMNAHLSKPIHADQLIDIIEQYCQ